MTTERLQEFAVLSSTLNYSNAAHILFITQSTLSRHISEMEEELGFQLFKRTTRNVELTEAGKQFSFSVSKLLEKYNNAVSRLHIKGVKSTGSIHIAYTQCAAFPPFLDFCKKFNAKYPGISLQLEISLTQGIGNLTGNELFFTPADYSDVPKSIKMIHVFQQSAYLFLPPNHPMVDKQNISLSDLKGCTLYIPNNDAAINGPYARNCNMALKYTGGDLKIAEVKNVTAALINVSLGNGAAILPRNQVIEEYRSYPCTKLYEPGCNFDVNVYFDAKNITPATALFLSELLPSQISIYSTEE